MKHYIPIRNISVLIILLIIVTKAKSQDKYYIDFIENKNQWNKNVLYKAEINNLQLYIEKNCFTYNVCIELIRILVLKKVFAMAHNPLYMSIGFGLLILSEPFHVFSCQKVKIVHSSNLNSSHIYLHRVLSVYSIHLNNIKEIKEFSNIS